VLSSVANFSETPFFSDAVDLRVFADFSSTFIYILVRFVRIHKDWKISETPFFSDAIDLRVFADFSSTFIYVLVRFVRIHKDWKMMPGKPNVGKKTVPIFVKDQHK